MRGKDHSSGLSSDHDRFVGPMGSARFRHLSSLKPHTWRSLYQTGTVGGLQYAYIEALVELPSALWSSAPE